jgi:hypothetical protein
MALNDNATVPGTQTPYPFPFIFISLVLFSFLLSSCVIRKMFITNIALTKDSMVIEIETKEINRHLPNELSISYKNIPEEIIFFTKIQEKWHSDDSSTAIFTVDLSDMNFAVYEGKDWIFDEFGNRIVDTFYINEEAVLFIRLTGSTFSADIFIEEDKIRILDQGYSPKHPFMY